MSELVYMNPPVLSKGRLWAALAVILFGQFVVSIDLTILNIALPDLTKELNPTSDQLLWIIDVYSLVVAGLLVATSSLSDRLGRKRMLLTGFFIFGFASGLIMIANSAEFVIGIRAILGVAGAMIMPVTISMIRSIFDDAKERAMAIAIWSAISAIGMAVGPLIGGVLLDFFSWHAAFFVNVPL
ncbi:MAG: MFS transporter, partial [Eggerthellaceae bacterium]